VESGQLHFAETSTGQLLICSSSLAVETRGKCAPISKEDSSNEEM
jgi:hypothetical protein